MMRCLELFAGTQSFSKVMRGKGHETITLDIDGSSHPDIISDILRWDIGSVSGIDMIWASPPCQCFSVASIGTHWTGGKKTYQPKTDKAKTALLIVDRTVRVISLLKPKYWCIENPRGVMRKIINASFSKYGVEGWHRTTITYCQYGDKRMKPTDVWTNITGWFGRRCHNGDRCHESAPRGSKTGTQGLKNAESRGVIPPALFRELLEHIKES